MRTSPMADSSSIFVDFNCCGVSSVASLSSWYPVQPYSLVCVLDTGVFQLYIYVK